MKQLKTEMTRLVAQTGKVEALLRDALPQTSAIINNRELNFNPTAYDMLGRCITNLSLFEDLRNEVEIVSEVLDRLD